ncbi:ester cyclase [Microlunatus sp. GCM10028923]|uniref:ester cyclase n=1 Tax=Microlunatus sp. GCM10028923 TaxID=3273400 RepID=UPI00361468F0
MTTTTTDRNADLLRQAFDHLNARDFEACNALMIEDFAINIAGAPSPRYGLDTWRQGIEVAMQAFPDLRAEVKDCFAAGDRVAVRLVFHGTHTGEFLGIPATGRTVSYDSNEIYRVVDGKIVEEWICSDLASLMGQLTAAE